MNHSFLPRLTRPGLLVVSAGLLIGCGGATPETTAPPDAASTTASTASPAKACAGDAGIAVPAGFCASIFADNLGHARQLAVAPNGDVYVNTWSSMYTKMANAPGGYIVALRDADRDGRAETVERFGPAHQEGKPGGGTGIAVYGGALYVEAADKIVRYALGPDGMASKAEPETIVSGLPQEGDHPMHPFVISPEGMLYMSSGSATNSCQEKNRTLESPGQKPCRELATHAGIWRYDAKKTGQTFSPRERYATGLRNPEALAVDPSGALFAAVHGRDQLSDNWPKVHTVEQQTELPAEIFARIPEGADFGWPTCYYDGMQGKHVLAPEYGGDGGKAVGECAQKAPVDVAFPAHWAPDGLAFYSGTAFPQKYQGGAFVSFHGSWNRKPRQAGYQIAFVPFAAGKPAGTYEEFATGFAGAELPADPSQAAYRPMGVAAGPDGALYVSDDVKGRIWRIAASN
jgi:glucose/arabinose dehydrogenase